MDSIFCRKQSEPVKGVNPFPLVHYSVEMDETGKTKFVETPVVAPSLAEEFSVVNNAMYGRMSHGSYRVSCDPVDFESKMQTILDE